MSRLPKILLVCAAALAVAAATAACGTQHIAVSRSNTAMYQGASLFNQRCAGCHSLQAAATYGSAPNIRTAQANSGPNFNQRCERPIDRILYAIENGGFSGAYMPQNIVVGQDAVDVAKFVATYAGRAAPRETGVKPCQDRPFGSLPAGSGTAQVASASQTSTSSSSSNSSSALTATAPNSTATATTATATAPKAKAKAKK